MGVFALGMSLEGLLSPRTRGDFFFKQERIGHRGPFTIKKIRTLEVHKIKEEAVDDEDPRLTYIGKFLRRTHMDELPQFGLVFKGHMTLVGPRPRRFYEFRDYYDWISQGLLNEDVALTVPEIYPRFNGDFITISKPGLTGEYQVAPNHRKLHANQFIPMEKEHYDLIRNINKCEKMWSEYYDYYYDHLRKTGKVVFSKLKHNLIDYLGKKPDDTEKQVDVTPV